jgi:hypothetical protein
VQETEPLGEHAAVAVQPVSVPVQDPLWPAEQLELTALLEVPVQVTVVPFQQLAVEVDLVGRPRRAAAS